jgi:heme O synthase-like polyprenyltransferase
MLTFSTHHAEDYRLAGVPVWPNAYGVTATRRLIAMATLLDVLVLGCAGWLLGVHPLAMGILGGMGAALLVLAGIVLIRPSKSLNWRLFKFASLYMLGAFICLTIGSVL